MSEARRHGEAPEALPGTDSPEYRERLLGPQDELEWMLFIGGPYNGQTMNVRRGLDKVELTSLATVPAYVGEPRPSDQEQRYIYVRRSIAGNPERGTKPETGRAYVKYQVRYIMLLLDWDTYPVEEIMNQFYEYLRHKWVAERPSKQVEIDD